MTESVISEALNEIAAAEQRLTSALAELELSMPVRLQALGAEATELNEKLATSEKARAEAERRVQALSDEVTRLNATNKQLGDALAEAESGNHRLHQAAAAMAGRIDTAIGQVKLALGT